MKFEYDDDADKGECVAYTDCAGGLILNTPTGKAILVSDAKNIQCHWQFDPTYATHRFYRGDKITITF